MRFRKLATLSIAACLGSAALLGGSALGAPAASPWGVYRGGGCVGVERMQGFVDWFGQRPARGLDFFSSTSWSELRSTAAWASGCWAEAGHMPMTFSVPMLVKGATLAEGAAGKYDEHFRAVARELVKRGYGDAIVRTGWEFNGDWMSWSAYEREGEFITYYRRIVTAMREVEGAAFRFDWTVANASTKQQAERAYPGDAYVDIIGLDVYNQSWSLFVRSPEQRWSELLEGDHGLLWHKRFAQKHGKPLSFPEWGTGTRPDKHGAGDDPYFIRMMAAWIRDNPVAYHNYWDYPAPDYNAELSAGRQPKAAAAFLRAFRSGVGKRAR